MIHRAHAQLLLCLALALVGCPEEDPALFTGVDASIDADIGSLVTVSWEQLEAAAGSVEFTFDDEPWRSTPASSWDPGFPRQLLLGVPYDSDLRYRLVMDAGDGAVTGDEHTIRTGELPPGVPHPEILVADPDAWDPSWQYLLASLDSGDITVRFWTHIFDRQGRVVWATPTPPLNITLQAQLSYDGHALLIDHNSYWAQFDDGAASQVLRMTLDGAVAETTDTPGLHHPFTELPDGTLAWGASDDTNETLETRTPDGTRRTVWDCAGFLADVGLDGWCSSNTLWFHEPEGTFLFSFFSLETVVEIDRTSGTALRHFGRADGAWAFDPPESEFHWQHGTVYTGDGTLLVSCRNGGETEDESETVVREYSLDPDTQTLHEVWNFAVGDGIYGDMMGEAHRLPGGNTLHNSGTALRVRETTPEGTVVWDVTWDRGSFLGRTTPLTDLYEQIP